MQVSTKLYNEQSINRFSDISGDIQKLQSRIATGKNVLKASDDPVAMINISAAKEKQSQLVRYASNIDRSMGRLGMAETSLSEMQSVLTRVYELSIQAKNDTYNHSDRKAIQVEMIELRELMLDMANVKDSDGNSLFSGYKSNVKPFITLEDGTTEYQGDQGDHVIPISENLTMPTSLNGADAFMRVNTDEGYTSVFTVMDNLIREVEYNGGSDSTLRDLKDSIDHLSINVTKMGALLNKAESQKNLIDQRQLMITETLSGLEDADIAKLVTKMQSLMVSRDAAQQSFVMIGQQNLFDFLR